MNFNGQFKRTRNINLGGKTSSGGASRQTVLQKAQSERERRERSRREEKAAIRIQSFYRGRLDVHKRRIQERDLWDSRYLDGGNPPSSIQLESCLREYVFFESKLFHFDDKRSTLRLKALDDIIVDEDTVSASNVSESILSTFASHNLRDILHRYSIGDVGNGGEGNLYYSLRLLYKLRRYTTSQILIDTSRVIKREDSLQLSSELNALLWNFALQLSKIHPKVFWIHILSIPYFYSRWGQYAKADGDDEGNLVPNIINSVILGDYDNNNSYQEKALLVEMDTKGLSWILTNLLRLMENYPLSINILAVLTSVLSAIYCSFNVKGLTADDHSNTIAGEKDNSSTDEEEEGGDPTSDDYLKRPLSDFIKDQFVLDSIDKLYTRSFTNEAFSLLSKDKSTAGNARQVFASFYVTLIKLHPARRKDILLYLSFVSDVSAVHTFWESFKLDSVTYALGSEGIIGKEDLETISSQDQQAWIQLVLTLELYSYWLIVADDSEIFEDNSRGLPVGEVYKLAHFLKNLTFSFLWSWSEIKPSQAPFKRLRDVALLVMRQIYIRDSRRPFLGKDFWLMTKHFNMSMFISGVVEEQDRLIKQEEGEPESEDEEVSFSLSLRRGGGGGGGRRGGNRQNRSTRPAERIKQNVEPRLNILREAPFFIPFDVRVNIFQEFIERDKERTGIVEDNFFSEFTGQQRIIEIFRGRELEDAFEKIPRSDNMKQKLRVSFQNEYGPESGIDGGGLTKEFLTSVCSEGFSEEKGLFVSTQNHLLYPNPTLGINTQKSGMEQSTREVELDQLEFLGKIIGKCLYDNVLVNVEFAPFFLQKSAGVTYRNSFDDLYSLDPEVYNSLVTLRKYSGDVEADLGLNFTIDQDIGDGKQVTLELIRNGENTPVTNSNRLEYVHAIANFKLNTVLAPQTNAFFGGMSQLISFNWLKMFNATELQMLISGGSLSIDIEDLKSHTQYGGYSNQSETVKNFWEIMEELPDADKCALIKFVTSVPKAPLGGFKRLEPSFAIRNSGEEVDRLPTASTCVNLLKLPNYKSKELLKEKLLYSIRSNAGFDLS